MFGALTMLAVGSALTRPPLFGLLSNLAPPHEQGATIGVAQGVGSLARIFGQIIAPTLLSLLPALPYLICAVILVGTSALVMRRFQGQAAAAGHGGAAQAGVGEV
jgi:hypothetical protein